MQKGDVPITYADTSDLERDFGYKPSTSLRETLREFSNWYYRLLHQEVAQERFSFKNTYRLC